MATSSGATTTIQISVATRDRLREFGDTYDEAVTRALDVLEEQDFWAKAERMKADFDALPEAERQAIIAERNRTTDLLLGAR